MWEPLLSVTIVLIRPWAHQSLYQSITYVTLYGDKITVKEEEGTEVVSWEIWHSPLPSLASFRMQACIHESPRATVNMPNIQGGGYTARMQASAHILWWRLAEVATLNTWHFPSENDTRSVKYLAWPFVILCSPCCERGEQTNYMDRTPSLEVNTFILTQEFPKTNAIQFAYAFLSPQEFTDCLYPGPDQFSP
jgi:hypothetical protein